MLTNLDSKFLARLKKGDIKAFEQVVFEYEKAIFGYVYHFINNRSDAEDITQIVFLKLYKNIGSIDLEKNFKSWLYRIATNTVYDWLRKKQRNPELLLIDDDESHFETIDEDSSYLTIEANLDLETAFKGLKDVYRNVIMLFYYEGFSYEEIAGILKLPLNTVKTYLRRAKEALKQELNKQNKYG